MPLSCTPYFHLYSRSLSPHRQRHTRRQRRHRQTQRHSATYLAGVARDRGEANWLWSFLPGYASALGMHRWHVTCRKTNWAPSLGCSVRVPAKEAPISISVSVCLCVCVSVCLCVCVSACQRVCASVSWTHRGQMREGLKDGLRFIRV